MFDSSVGILSWKPGLFSAYAQKWQILIANPTAFKAYIKLAKLRRGKKQIYGSRFFADPFP